MMSARALTVILGVSLVVTCGFAKAGSIADSFELTEMNIPIDASHSFFNAQKHVKSVLEQRAEPGEPLSGAAFGEALFAHVSKGRPSREQECPFKLWWPAEQQPRAVYLYSLHHGRPDLAFCKKNRLAAVGFFGDPVQRGAIPDSVMRDALTRLGEEAGHPELPKMPFIAFGFSNGSGAATALAAQFPEQCIAWVACHPGGSWPLTFPGIERSPGLVVHGMKDGWFTGHDQEVHVRRLRKDGAAPVALAINPDSGHGISGTMAQVFHAFFEAVLERRNPRRNDDGSFVMDPFPLEEGYLGQPYDKAAGGYQDLRVVAYSEFDGDPASMDWLPGKKFAEAWQGYSKAADERK